jgi:fructokinase
LHNQAVTPLWGIDLGGTKIEGVVLTSIKRLEIACRLRIATEADQGYRHVVGQIERLVGIMAAETGLPRPARIGIGTPGTVDPRTGLIKNSNTICLNGSALPRDLSVALGAEVVIANDANCFALAEATMGSGVGFPTVFGVILGTGVGGGIVVDGKVLSGAQGIAGEWGHNLLEPDGELCYCGKRGCVETVLSGPALQRFYAARSGGTLPLSHIASRSREDEPAAVATVARLCANFGLAMSQVVNVVDPHAIILGGGVGNIDELYTIGRDELAKNVFNNRLDTKLLRPALGDSAGVFGAALLAEGLP